MEKMNTKIKYKRGWVRLVEVFIAILLIAGVLLIVANRANPSEKNIISSDISEKELAILKDIELNKTLRTEILNVPSLPVEWNNFSSELQNLKNRIEYLASPNLNCEAKICLMDNEVCVMSEFSGDNVYAESVVISADLNKYSPRQFKLFCIES